MHMTLHLTWPLLLQGLELFLLRSEKNATLTVSIEIHKGAIFYGLKIKCITVFMLNLMHLM
jgi:hypothetical protein